MFWIEKGTFEPTCKCVQNEALYIHSKYCTVSKSIPLQLHNQLRCFNNSKYASFYRGTLYDCRFEIVQTTEVDASITLSAEVNFLPDFTAIAETISSSTEILSAFGKCEQFFFNFIDWQFQI